MRWLIFTYLFPLFIAGTGAVLAQNEVSGILPMVDGHVAFEKVVEIDQRDLEEHTETILAWMYKEGFSQIEFERQSGGRLHFSSVGNFHCLWGPNDYRELYKEIGFKLDLVVKKDRMQYTFSDFMVRDQKSTYHLEIYRLENRRDMKHTADMHKQIDSRIKDYIQTLVLQMNSTTARVISRG